MRKRQQGTTLYTTFLWLIGTLVVIQLWLLGAALDAMLAGERGVLVPAAAASLILLAVNGGMLAFVLSFDRRVRRAVEDERGRGRQPGVGLAGLRRESEARGAI